MSKSRRSEKGVMDELSPTSTSTPDITKSVVVGKEDKHKQNPEWTGKSILIEIVDRSEQKPKTRAIQRKAGNAGGHWCPKKAIEEFQKSVMSNHWQLESSGSFSDCSCSSCSSADSSEPSFEIIEEPSPPPKSNRKPARK